MQSKVVVTDCLGRMLLAFVAADAVAYRQREDDVLVHMRQGHVHTLRNTAIADVSRAFERDSPEEASKCVNLCPGVFVRPEAIDTRQGSRTSTRLLLRNGNCFWVPMPWCECRRVLTAQSEYAAERWRAHLAAEVACS